MRIVAIALLTLVVAAASPAHADRMHELDDCSNQVFLPGESGTSCIRLELPEPVASASSEKLGGRLFIWTGDDGAKDTTTVTTGTAAILGTVYEDSNGYPGLQRDAAFLGGQTREPDQALLI